MQGKKVAAVILLVVGGASLCFSSYIQSQIDAGQQKIQKVQKSVDTGNKIFSFTPQTKELGESLSKPIQKKIDSGQMTIDNYQKIASYLSIGGWIFAIIGAVFLIYSFFVKRST